MRRPAITLIFLSLVALLVTEGFVVFRFLKGAADATRLVDVERQLAHEASGITRKVISQARSGEAAIERAQSEWVALQEEEAEIPRAGARGPALNARSRAR